MKPRPLTQDKSRYKVLTRRTLMLGGIQAGLVGTLAARMYYLQVLQADAGCDFDFMVAERLDASAPVPLARSR